MIILNISPFLLLLFFHAFVYGFVRRSVPIRRFELYSKVIVEPKIPKTTKRYMTTRAGKTETIGHLGELLRRSQVLLRYTYRRFTPNERRLLNRRLRSFIYVGKDGSQPCAKLRMVKNTLMEKAMAGTAWEVFAPRMHGPSMCFFIFDEGRLPHILSTVERLRASDKKIRRHVTLESASFAGKVVEPDELFSLATYNSREDMIAKLMVALNGGATSVAGGLRSVASKLAMALNEITKKHESVEPTCEVVNST
ncbi:putative 50S ribosomal protein [Babesia sp. Xinjiang]|uniref:putative 50S ribosomal protein n=1 Tax=Babesia sp. Xinjiang TaxID=462227 RepID=UPI000A2364C9|nr:putative 50S ribosomal protein [Babesia sp. Xinjiang]ORM39767.1 putative 50S ribosomal protein [Babesia sp. Xinjiang]